jgi:hypothetical protein
MKGVSVATPALEKLRHSSPCIDVDPAEFAVNFNRASFELGHSLSSEPLFQLPALMDLAERMLKTRPLDLHYDMGNIRIDQRWDEAPEKPFSPKEALGRIENCGAWFIFKATQLDPEYKVFLDRGLGYIKDLVGERINSQILVEDALVFVTSPKRISSYHIDRECNFLLQIRGTKTIHIFDRENREVLPEVEIERFWAVDHNAAIYKPHLQDHAKSYKMRPGMGVHIPVNCPHWLENDDNVSVSLSLNFQFKDSMRANSYRANYILRKLGLNPTPPGKSAWLDALKSCAILPAVWARKAFKSLAR